MAKWKKSSILYVWLQSYVLVLLIPVVMMGVVYWQTNKVIEDEVNRANSSLLKQLQEEIDSQIEHVQRMREVIAFNGRVRKLLFAPEELSADLRLTMVQTFADFRTYSSTNRYIDDYYIYFRNGDFVLTERSYYKPETYFKLNLSHTEISYETWRSFLDQQHQGTFMNSQDVAKGEQKTQHGEILLSQSLPLENTSSRLATLVIYLNKERLQSSLQNIQSYNEGIAYIMDGNHQILASSGSMSSEIPGDFEPLEEYGVSQIKANDDEHTVSYIQSSLTDWTYVYSLPSGVYREKVEYARNISILMIVIALLLGAGVAVYTARRNYHPIKRLVHSLTMKSKHEPEQTRNEIHYIWETLEHTLEKNDEMNRVIEQQNNFLRSNLLVRLLKGRLETNFPLEEALAEYRLTVGPGSYSVVLFYIEDFRGLFRSTEELDPEKNLRFVHMIMSNIIEELVGKRHIGWMTEADEMLACIINFTPGTDTAQAKTDVLHMLEDARSLIGQRFHIEFTCTLSAIHPSIHSIPTAYSEAVEAMEYRMLMGSGTTIDYESIQEQGTGYVYPIEMEQKLINYVKSGDYPKAKATMDEVFESNLNDSNLTVDLARCFMFDLISTMMKASMEVVSDQTDLYVENQIAVRAILQQQTATEMRQRMDLFLQKVCEHVNDRKKSHNVQLNQEILKYIEENYMDPNLSVAGISEHFDIHPSYLSRFFKEQTGDTLSDYLNRYRILQAKQLLVKEESISKNVSEAVGIYSVSTFIRLFKKYEGVTPGVYRDMNKTDSSATQG